MVVVGFRESGNSASVTCHPAPLGLFSVLTSRCRTQPVICASIPDPMIQTLQANFAHHVAPSSSPLYTQPMPAVTPQRIPTHAQAIHDFDPSLLASTSTASSSPNMYLNFKAGEIIRVHVRDGTGWWDGEISSVVEAEKRDGPRRGWFPSNYVREMGWDGVSLSVSPSGKRS